MAGNYAITRLDLFIMHKTTCWNKKEKVTKKKIKVSWNLYWLKLNKAMLGLNVKKKTTVKH